MTRFVDRSGQELPGEFSPPENAAERIAALKTLAEREAYWLRIPEAWRPMIGTLAVHALARRIHAMPTKMERQDAIHSVPELWRAEVKALVVSFFNTRHLRSPVTDQVAA